MSSVRISRVPTYSGFRSLFHNFAYGTVTLFDLSFNTVRLSCPMLNAVLTPQVLLPAVWAPPISLATTLSCPMLNAVLTPQVLLPAVWAPPISLATTLGIVFTFFSSGY